MASTLVSSGDLLHEIFQYCPRQDIANLRQCSRQFETIASDYLFTTLTVGLYFSWLSAITVLGLREASWS